MSLICSPVPTNRMGRPSSREMATTMPPLAVPSSFVRMMPVTPTEEVNSRACARPFWPVVASITRRMSWGGPGITFAAVRLIFSSSILGFDLVDGGGAEGGRSAKDDAAAVLAKAIGEFADAGGFAGPVYTDDEDYAGVVAVGGA